MIRDRAAISREIEGGQIENVYRLQIMNTVEHDRRFIIRVEGLPTVSVAGESRVDLPSASTRMVALKVRVQPGPVGPGTHKIRFVIEAEDDARVFVAEKSVFIVRQ